MNTLPHPQHAPFGALALPPTTALTVQAAPVAKQQTQVPGYYRLALVAYGPIHDDR